MPVPARQPAQPWWRVPWVWPVLPLSRRRAWPVRRLAQARPG